MSHRHMADAAAYALSKVTERRSNESALVRAGWDRQARLLCYWTARCEAQFDLLRQLVALHNPKAYAEPCVQRLWEQARRVVEAGNAPDAAVVAQVEREVPSRTDTAGGENVQENEGGSEMEGCSKMPRFKVGDLVQYGTSQKRGTVIEVVSRVWVDWGDDWGDDRGSTWFYDHDDNAAKVTPAPLVEPAGDGRADTAETLELRRKLSLAEAERDEALLTRGIARHERDELRAEVERLTAKLNATATTASYGYAGPSPVLDALRDSLVVTDRACDEYGGDHQLLVAIGEAGEFIDAASRYARGDGGDDVEFRLLDETADLLIVGTATTRLFDSRRLAEHIRAKVARLAERLDGGE